MRSKILLVKAEKKELICFIGDEVLMILAGDIGGTNTRLALFERDKRIVEKKFTSKNYEGLQPIVEEFLQGRRESVQAACFGVAGPVQKGVCRTTNIPWTIDAHQLSQNLRIRLVTLLNDLEANAYGLRRLKKEELFRIHAGKEQLGNQALIAAGTGLGEAGLYWDGKEHRPFACEGGHADFAPRDERECELFLFLKKKLGHVSYERVVSGPGLVLLYQFLIETGREKESPDAKREMAQSDPSKVISEWGKVGRDAACSHALEWFLSLYGAEAGNIALKFLALGGVFVGGGIAPHLIEKMQTGPFLRSFFNKGRFQALLESISVWVVLNDDAALLGAAYFGEKTRLESSSLDESI